MPKTVRFYTLGCKVNQYDSEAMLEAFVRRGYTPALRGMPADVYVVNTCTVTGTGDQKSLKAARRYKRQNPGGEHLHKLELAKKQVLLQQQCC